MKVVIIIEDTHIGVAVGMEVYRNGVQDHIPDSLAVMNTAFIQASLAHSVKCAHMNVHWTEPGEDECHPTRQNLLT